MVGSVCQSDTDLSFSSRIVRQAMRLGRGAVLDDCHLAQALLPPPSGSRATHSVGVQPVINRNSRLRWAWSKNPARRATSTGEGPSLKRLLRFSEDSILGSATPRHGERMIVRRRLPG